MLCASCTRSLLLRLPSTLHPSSSLVSRSVVTVSNTPGASPLQAQHLTTSPNAPSPALSSATPGVSLQPSTPMLPAASTATPRQNRELPKPTTLQGSIPGGSPLFGIAYLKAKPTVLAMEDDAYPEWLWSLLAEGKKSAVSGDATDPSPMTKKQRQKYDRKQEKLRKTIPKRIPVHEQSKDLTGPDDNAVVSLERRQEITKSSRAARRKGIRESNFLRSM